MSDPIAASEIAAQWWQAYGQWADAVFSGCAILAAFWIGNSQTRTTLRLAAEHRERTARVNALVMRSNFLEVIAEIDHRISSAEQLLATLTTGQNVAVSSAELLTKLWLLTTKHFPPVQEAVATFDSPMCEAVVQAVLETVHFHSALVESFEAEHAPVIPQDRLIKNVEVVLSGLRKLRELVNVAKEHLDSFLQKSAASNRL